MLKVRRRSYFVASSAVFAVVYAILGLIPVSPYIGVRSFLTFREILAPLAGMTFGPLVGGFSMVLGNFVDFALGKPVVFDFLDFVPDLASAVMAGLAFSRRKGLALVLPLALVLWYSLDPLSAKPISLGGIPVPFYWMHLLSVGTLGVAFWLERNGRVGKLGPIYVGAVAFASTMTGHIAGSVLFENITVRVNATLTAEAIAGQWYYIFFAYPPERVLFTILGTMIAVPVLRSLIRIRKPAPAQS
ncbi:MAG: ECF transporter S component [Thaumarchaeota archaeon]|nr:ECF transporter S component [Nitrososphaerota archaeon]